ncbi:hypothetical protein, partial [Vogesella mureinivorans]|uniref:hypothetical protein n=1 Tax=Vogesella mureinivorans TaxID=657276 RepID=UPI001479060A
TYTYRLFGLLKSGADWLVSFASSADGVNYTLAISTRQQRFYKKAAIQQSKRSKLLILKDFKLKKYQ